MQYCDRLRYCTSYCISDIPIKNISVIHSLRDVICYKSIFNMPSSHILGIRVGYKCYDLKEFVFSHDKAASLLKEYFHELEMDKTHIYVVFTY